MSRMFIALLIIVSIVAASCTFSTTGNIADGTYDPPDCPSGLIVAKQTATSLTLVWDEVDNADGYILYRSISGDAMYSQIIQSDVSDTQYNDSPLISVTTYYYKIQAFNSYGSSELSLPTSGTTFAVAAGPPETPTGLWVSNPTESSLTVTWNASEGSKGYILYNSISSTGPYYLLYDGPMTPVKNYALPNKTTVYYKVAAYNANGRSSLSDWVSGTTLAKNHTSFGGLVYADDGQFLGVINDNEIDPNSLANSFGTYGSQFSTYSIWNEYSIYGSVLSSLSAYNSLASSPPRVYVNSVFYAYLTTNTVKIPRLDPDSVALAIGRSDVIR